jgi:hypothetical protein
MVDRQDDHSEMSSGTPLEEASVEEFAASFKGELIRPEDARLASFRRASRTASGSSPLAAGNRRSRS